MDMTKEEALRGRVDVYIDDAVHNYEDLNSKGVLCKLISRPHNMWFDAGNDRYDDILDFQERFKIETKTKANV